ncbi:hypothetical protein [Actinomadura opuntiae]|uniref:hypothetical protein n=1 Tax=Actinomadura sp. OS1-43 TaxID=604315 RepID=UPI00255B0083|nr:hypothetical protein [Actinomadura sp. OS1-43]MDL4820010.1 hypothetical protein [Actinomadura sp. OS1-43]
MSSSPAAAHSLDPVPHEARESTAAHQFWSWSGADIALINWVLGALVAGGLYFALSARRGRASEGSPA